MTTSEMGGTPSADTNQSPLRASLQAAQRYLTTRIVGQATLIERLLIALLSGGHLLVEGAPGLAKTRAIKELARVVEGDFHRIQFTPDLLPGDVTGTEVFRPEDGSFKFQPGPIFHNLLLADEVNRAPAKVQSALLEAMAEHQVSVGRRTYHLPDLFLVMATQNPIEQEGTYPLPEAQLDRFLMQVNVDYPDASAERQILALVRQESQGATPEPPVRLNQQQIFAARSELLEIYMSPAVETYLIQLVMATRDPGAYSAELAEWLEYGASPRASIALDMCSRALAWLNDRDFVTPDDVQGVAADVLRHRLLLSFAAQADGISTDHVIERLLELVPVP
jgi:MoxR-like ATPase